MKYYMAVTMRYECEVEAEDLEGAEYEVIVEAKENAWFEAYQLSTLVVETTKKQQNETGAIRNLEEKNNG